jgi:hypothetical protein
MAMNVPTYSALRKMAKLIDGKLSTQTSQDVVDEIRAWNRLLKKHLGQQKRQPAAGTTALSFSYRYDKASNKVQRIKNNKVEAEY